MARRSGKHKGERPIIHPPLIWSTSGVIAHMIRTGDHWLRAWQAQQLVPLDKLAKASGVSPCRINAMVRGGDATTAELEAIAPVLNTYPTSLRASIGYQVEVDLLLCENRK